MDDLAIIDRFTDTFSRYIDSGFGLVHGEIAFLTATLVAIDMTLAGLAWAMGHGGQDEILGRLVKKTLYVGAFAYLIGNFNALAGILFRSFAGLGLMASGSTISQAQLLQPGRLAQVGVDTAAPLLEQVGRLSGFTTIFANFETIVVLLLAWVVVIISFFVLSIQLFVTLLEFKLTTLAGFVLVPFALWGKTAFLAEKVLGNVISSGIKVLVLAVIVGISTLVFNDFRTGISAAPTLNEATAVMLASLAMLGLGIFGPGIATGLVSGAPQLGAGAAVGTAVGAAGIAAAGVAVGASAAGSAARLSGGGVRAAASMSAGARKAYVEGSSFSGQTGLKAAAAGFKDVARAGASAVGSRMKASLRG
ncbi:MAG: P-type conjugative transfer protein TrbL, partial [Bordetella sp. SCN 68-11]